MYIVYRILVRAAFNVQNKHVGRGKFLCGLFLFVGCFLMCSLALILITPRCPFWLYVLHNARRRVINPMICYIFVHIGGNLFMSTLPKRTADYADRLWSCVDNACVYLCWFNWKYMGIILLSRAELFVLFQG